MPGIFGLFESAGTNRARTAERQARQQTAKAADGSRKAASWSAGRGSRSIGTARQSAVKPPKR